MAKFHLVLFRVSIRVLFLSVTLFLGWVFWYLPNLLKLDMYRPQAISLLKNTFHCRVEVGNINGEILPYPGLIVTHVALLDLHSPRVLASVGVMHLYISPLALLHRQMQFPTLRFVRPRFIRYRVQEPGGKISWVDLALEGVEASTAPALASPRAPETSPGVEQIEIRNGSGEIWDTTQSPVVKWPADHFDGSYDVQKKIGAASGRAPGLGPDCLVNVHYNAADPYPITVHVDNLDLTTGLKRLQWSLPALNGHANLIVKARFNPDPAVRITLTNLLLDRLEGAWIRGSFSFEDETWRAHLITGTHLPMTVAAEGRVVTDGWTAHATVARYNAQLVQAFYDQSWLNRLAGRGTMTVDAEQSGKASWNWHAEGNDFALAGSDFQVPHLSAQGDATILSVNVHGVSPEQGTADVAWVQPLTDSAAASLRVNVSSVTIRQVLEIFSLQSTSTVSTERWNPAGYEAWRIDNGSMQATIDSDTFHVESSQLQVAGMGVDVKGEFGLVQDPSPAHLQGALHDIPVGPIIESFFQPPSPITGTGQLHFDLRFPLSRDWLNQLKGPVEVTIANGIVRELKTFYRITSVLNLTNYFRLRLPQITAEGILFQSINGHLQFQNGILKTDDLFLKSPNLNFGAKGSLDLPGQRIDTTLRLEILKFIDEVLKVVPITHWLFKKPNKILFPLVVTVKGPWSDVDVR